MYILSITLLAKYAIYSVCKINITTLCILIVLAAPSLLF